MSNSELTVIIERYKKGFITMDNAIGLIKGIVYAKELLHEVTQRSILQEKIDNAKAIVDTLLETNEHLQYLHDLKETLK